MPSKTPGSSVIRPSPLSSCGHLVPLHVFRLDSPDERGVDLAQRNQAQDVLAFSYRADKRLPICSHDLPVIRIGKTQIEVEFPGFSGLVDGCSPADTGTESMNEPGKLDLCPAQSGARRNSNAGPRRPERPSPLRSAVRLGLEGVIPAILCRPGGWRTRGVRFDPLTVRCAG